MFSVFMPVSSIGLMLLHFKLITIIMFSNKVNIETKISTLGFKSKIYKNIEHQNVYEFK